MFEYNVLEILCNQVTLRRWDFFDFCEGEIKETKSGSHILTPLTHIPSKRANRVKGNRTLNMSGDGADARFTLLLYIATHDKI